MICDIEIRAMQHDGWSTIFHRDIEVKSEGVSCSTFRKNFRLAIEDVLDNKTPYRYYSLSNLKRNGTVLQFIHHYEVKLGYEKRRKYMNQTMMHVEVSELDWLHSINEFSQKVFEQ